MSERIREGNCELGYAHINYLFPFSNPRKKFEKVCVNALSCLVHLHLDLHNHPGNRGRAR